MPLLSIAGSLTAHFVEHLRHSVFLKDVTPYETRCNGGVFVQPERPMEVIQIYVFK